MFSSHAKGLAVREGQSQEEPQDQGTERENPALQLSATSIPSTGPDTRGFRRMQKTWDSPLRSLRSTASRGTTVIKLQGER